MVEEESSVAYALGMVASPLPAQLSTSSPCQYVVTLASTQVLQQEGIQIVVARYRMGAPQELHERSLTIELRQSLLRRARKQLDRLASGSP